VGYVLTKRKNKKGLNQKEIIHLFSRYLENRCTADEIRRLLRYFDLKEEEGTLKELIKFALEEPVEEDFADSSEMQKALAQTDRFLADKIAPAEGSNGKIAYLKYSAIAASIALLLGVGIFFLHKRSQDDITNKKHTAIADVMPGGNKAMLTMANGKTVVLDNNLQEIREQEGVTISKGADGQLIYRLTDHNNQPTSTSEVAYNTISTPKGGQYQVVLPDGSRVWLNAASSLTFPLAFERENRMVTLTGEGYFDITQDRKRPFIVKTDNQLIKVLGTQFNVNSYPDEQQIKTTLIDGKVSIGLEVGRNKILKPGQQAVLSKTDGTLMVGAANLEEALAWKNGWFVFEDAYLKDILKTVARWYEIEIDYSEIPAMRYNGAIPRNVNLSKVLAMLEKTGNISFNIKDGRVEIK
jgi:transmembrane sensor